MTKKQIEENKAFAKAKLLEFCPEGKRIYTVLQHKSKTGMIRCVSFFVTVDNIIVDITGYIIDLLGLGFDRRHGGARISGCGMDVGYRVVDNLSRSLYGACGKLNHQWL